MTTIIAQDQLASFVRKTVAEQPVTDLHTHLYSPEFGGLLLRGIDELLTYHYLVAEVMRWSDIAIEDFWKLSKQEQADLIWQELFINHSPISEACRGVLTCLEAFGQDVGSRDLASYRKFFDGMTPAEHVDATLKLAKVEHVVMTNDIFNEEERNIWLSGVKYDERFHAVLRMDPLLNDYANTKSLLREWGYAVEDEWNEATIAEVRRFLTDWIDRMNPLYMAVSLPPSFAFPEDSDRSRVIADCILPISRERNIPFAMMIGVKKRVHPALGDAGDYVAKAGLESLEHMLLHYPQNKFLVTMLSRENQHELTTLARKFRNLMVFGCWWFLNNPVFIDEMTRMRMEMLGTSMIPQHSDARVLDQVVYKWSHSKRIIADALIDKYNDIVVSGWQVTAEEIQRDVADLFYNNFWNFLKRELPGN